MYTVKPTLFDALVYARRSSADMSMAGSVPLYVTDHLYGFRISRNKPWGGSYYMAMADRVYFMPANNSTEYEVIRLVPNMLWGAY